MPSLIAGRADEIDPCRRTRAANAPRETGSRAARRNRGRPSRTSPASGRRFADNRRFPTRLILPWPSIWPPPRKKASTRPCARAVEQFDRAVGEKLCSREPSTTMRTRSSPRASLRARSSMAPAAGIGEEAPTATKRTPLSRSPMVAIRIIARCRGPPSSRDRLERRAEAVHYRTANPSGRSLANAGVARDLGVVGPDIRPTARAATRRAAPARSP